MSEYQSKQTSLPSDSKGGLLSGVDLDRELFFTWPIGG